MTSLQYLMVFKRNLLLLKQFHQYSCCLQHLCLKRAFGRDHLIPLTFFTVSQAFPLPDRKIIFDTSTLDQVYSNTRVSTRINTSQHESTRINTSQHESTRARHEPTGINTSPTRVNTNQHEPDTSQHESTRV